MIFYAFWMVVRCFLFFFFSVALLWFFYDFPVFFVFDGFAMVPIWLNDVKCGCLMVPMII